MPKLRALSGDDILRIFAEFGFQTVLATRWSREAAPSDCYGPDVDKGARRAIFRQRFDTFPESELAPHFFAE